MNFEQQVQKQLGVKPADFAKAKDARAKMTRSKPQEKTAQMTAQQKTARKLLRADPVHQVLCFATKIALQEDMQPYALFSSMADRALNASNFDDGGDAPDVYSDFLADMGRFTRMRATGGQGEDIASLRDSLMQRFSKIMGNEDPDEASDGEVENDEGDAGDLRSLQDERMPKPSPQPSPSPVDKNPKTGSPAILRNIRNPIQARTVFCLMSAATR